MPENGNYEEDLSGRGCRTRVHHHLLADPDRVRREEEQERRKLRLLQVREESRKLAHKIRQDVAAEKQRQLDKFNATKAAEMECWRQNAMVQQAENYTWAVLHLGVAHNAAMVENANRRAAEYDKQCRKDCRRYHQSEKRKSPLRKHNNTSCPRERSARKCLSSPKRMQKSARYRSKSMDFDRMEETIDPPPPPPPPSAFRMEEEEEERFTGGCCLSGCECPQNKEECNCNHVTDFGGPEEVSPTTTTDADADEDVDPGTESCDNVQRNEENKNAASSGEGSGSGCSSGSGSSSSSSTDSSLCSIGQTTISSMTTSIMSRNELTEEDSGGGARKSNQVPYREAKKSPGRRCCTPTVLVDVEVGPDDCIEITSPYYGDYFCKDNIKLNRIVITNPVEPESTSNNVSSPTKKKQSPGESPKQSAGRRVKSSSGSRPLEKSPNLQKVMKKSSKKLIGKVKRIAVASSGGGGGEGKESSPLPAKRKSIRPAASKTLPPPGSGGKKSLPSKLKSKSMSMPRNTKSERDEPPKKKTTSKSPTVRIVQKSRSSSSIQENEIHTERKEECEINERKSMEKKVAMMVTTNTKEAHTQTMTSSDPSSNPVAVVQKSISCEKIVRNQSPSPSPSMKKKKKHTTEVVTAGGGVKKTISQISTATYTKTESIKSGGIKSYDYNSKSTTNKFVPINKLMITRNTDRSKPNAMEEAKKENLLRQKLNEELQEKSQIMEKRCQKAIERQQIRTDYNDLAEKLENLLQKYPDNLPTSSKTAQMVADKRLRLENKLEAALEDLLKKPAIITCPEIKKNDKVAPDKMLNDLNIGGEATSVNDDELSKSSCCSLLLEYVNDQVKEVQKDLNQSVEKDNRDEVKEERLRYLLGRLDRLRNSLLKHLTKMNAVGTDSSSPQQKNCKRVDKEMMTTNDKQQEEEINVKPTTTTTTTTTPGSSSMPERNNTSNLDQRLHGTLTSPNRRFPGKIQKPEGCSGQTIAREKRLLKTNNNNNNNNDPLEIIITVRGESRTVEVPSTTKGRNRWIQRRTCPKPTTTTTTTARTPVEKTRALLEQQPSFIQLNVANNEEEEEVNEKTKITNSMMEQQNSSEEQNPVPISETISEGVCKSSLNSTNSTSYRSLPSNVGTRFTNITRKLANYMDNDDEMVMVDKKKPEPQETPLKCPENGMRMNPPQLDMNPRLAQYVNRLLKMPRSSVQALGISSSEVETPSISVINISSNNPQKKTKNTLDVTLQENDERINKVESFLEDNRNFIKELESTLEAHNQVTLDTSRQIFDEIWRCRLAQQGVVASSSSSPCKLVKGGNTRETKELGKKKDCKVIVCNPSSKDREDSSCRNNHRKTREQQKVTLNDKKSPQFQSLIERKEEKQPICKKVMLDKSVETVMTMDTSLKHKDNSKEEDSSSSKNCVNRIKELTELIKKVRMEKKRIIEITLSSVSENGGGGGGGGGESSCIGGGSGPHSTDRTSEETPSTQIHSNSRRCQQQSSASDNGDDSGNRKALKVCVCGGQQIPSNREMSSCDRECICQLGKKTPETPIHSPRREMFSKSSERSPTSVAPRTGIKDRSGANSPPSRSIVETKMVVWREPASSYGSHIIKATEKEKEREEEREKQHNQSPIIEEPPSTTMENAGGGEGTVDDDHHQSRRMEPVPFPTFDEYVKWLQLNISDMDGEQSIKLENEFLMYLEAIKKCPMEDVLEYKKFPTISRYIVQNAQEGNWSFLSQPPTPTLTSETMMTDPQLEDGDGMVYNNRLQTLEPEPFTQPPPPPPPPSSSLQQQTTTITTSGSSINLNSDNDSTPMMNLEDELKRRKIIKQSYDGRPYKRVTPTGDGRQLEDEMFGVSSTYTSKVIQKVMVDGLSTLEEEYVDRMQMELNSLLSSWSKCLNKRSLEEKSDRSTTMTTSCGQTKTSSEDEDHSGCKLGKPMNLRNFLTRELIKHAASPSSLSSSTAPDDSMRVKFLQAIVDQMSSSSGGEELLTNSNSRRTRKKTSTPLHHPPPLHSTETSGNRYVTSSQLFSGESRLSSVPCPEPYQSLRGKEDNVGGHPE